MQSDEQEHSYKMEWYEEDYNDKIRFGLRVKQVVYQGRSPLQTIDIVDTELFGRALALDGAWMTSERDEAHYHEMIVHPALCSAETIERVLVIGGGDGGTVREVLRHSGVTYVTLVEIDQMVMDVCKEHLSSFNVPWGDPRLHILAQDGVAFLRNYSGPPFNVIIVDGADPVGPAEGLYDISFYQSAKNCLSPNGVLVTQSESPIAMESEFQAIHKSLKSSFNSVAPYIVPIPLYPSGMWSFCLASNYARPLNPARTGKIVRKSKYFNTEIYFGAFCLPTFVRKLIER